VRPSTLRAALLLVLGVAAAAWMVPYGLRAGFHSDELNVLWHARRFWAGDVYLPGRPGLLFLALSPVMAFDDPVTVLHASRWATIAASLASLGLVGWLATPRGDAGWDRQLLGPVAVLLLATAGLWGTHSIEVRTDSFTTPLTLAAIAVLWSRTWRPWTVAAGAVLVAAAVLCSQKSAYNTAGLAAAWLIARPALPAPGWGPRARDAGVAVAVGGACLALWFGGMVVVSTEGSGVLTSTVAVAAKTAFGGGVPWDDKVTWLATAVQRAPVLWLAAPVGLLISLFRRDGRVAASALVAAALVGVMPIHRGFFPYYISSIEPLLALPAAEALVSLGAAFAAIKPLGRAAGPLGAAAVGALLLSQLPGQRTAFEQAWVVDSRGQEALAERVHELFPEPVPYLAGINVVPNYPEVVGYLTAQQRTGRRARQRNFLADTLRAEQVRFFARNYMTRDRYLKGPERKLLYLSYPPLAPNLYVHGARLRWDAGSSPGRRSFELLVDGDYTVTVRGAAALPPLRIDGEAVQPGDRLSLTAGMHRAEVGEAQRDGEVWLVLGEGVGPRTDDVVDYSTFPKDRKNSRSRYQRYDNKKASWDLVLLPHAPGRKNAVRNHKRRRAQLERRYAAAALMKRD